MAMREPMMQEDVKSVEETSGVEKVEGLGKSKGEMSFPERRARAAKMAMSKEMSKGVPKRWKGRGDYFFEQMDDGGLKITGGDSAKSLTGGKSTVIRDSDEIKRIFEAARGGDIVEEGAMYEKADTTFRGGGSPGLEYLNETDADFFSAAERDPEATQLDSGRKRMQAVRTHRDIIQKEIPEINDQMTREILQKPEIKLLADTVDRLAASEDPSMNAAVQALADLLVKRVKQERGF